MAQQTSIPKGTRDFLPEVMSKRNYIFNTIIKVYKKYGFVQIETPAMENLSTLMGKYGDEGDKLLFRILNSGDFLKSYRSGEKSIMEENIAFSSKQISEKGLRYDLTVPLARFVVQHRSDIVFPFKRYQLQAVWRADRPQKGRYREFYQCDADVIGSNSLINEMELVAIIDEVFSQLNLKVDIRFNNRKILSGIAELIGEKDKITDITVAIDKLDKIGMDKVIEELKLKDISDEAIKKLLPVLNLSGDNREKLTQLKNVLLSSEEGLKGVAELEELCDLVDSLGVSNCFSLDLTLARGLNYYTGAIFEVVSQEAKMGSICGGGRYDDLTGVFGMKDVSGVGISFGTDRIYDIINELNRFPDEIQMATKVLIVNFGGDEQAYALKILKQLRMNDIRSEVYPDTAKMKKQMQYANNKHIPFVILVGSDELQSNTLSLKDMLTGEQKTVTVEECVALMK